MEKALNGLRFRVVAAVVLGLSTSLLPCWIFGWPYLGEATAATSILR